MPDPQQTDGPVQEPVIEGPLAQELEQHKGRWVAVFEDRIVAVSDSAVEVKDEALRKGVTDPLVFRVPQHPNRLAFFDVVPWYQYSATPAGSKPYVAVRLIHGNRQVQLVALVDSGADSSLLDIGYADLLGLDRSDAVTEEAIVASGEPITVYKWPEGLLELQFETDRFPFRGSFIEYSANADGDNLMGRADFFEHFIVQFWDARDLMNIDLSPDFPHGDAVSQLRKSESSTGRSQQSSSKHGRTGAGRKPVNKS